MCTCSYRDKTLYIETGPVAEQPRWFRLILLFCIFDTLVSSFLVCCSCPVPPDAALSTLRALVFVWVWICVCACACVCECACAQWPQLRLRLASNWVCLTATGSHLWPLGCPHLLSVHPLGSTPQPQPIPDLSDQFQFKNFIYLLALILLQSNDVASFRTNESLRRRQHSYPSFFCVKNYF